MDLVTLIREALAEDIGPGDITTDSTVDEHAEGRGRIVAKQDLVVCGHGPAQLVFAEMARRLGRGFVYEVAAGCEHEGFAAGTAWADIPEDWCCPDCGVREKIDFVAFEPAKAEGSV